MHNLSCISRCQDEYRPVQSHKKNFWRKQKPKISNYDITILSTVTHSFIKKLQDQNINVSKNGILQVNALSNNMK